MKKWLIALCCILVAASIAFVTVLNQRNTQIDTLNQDLGNLQAEYNHLKEKSDHDDETIQQLNQQVDTLTQEAERLTAENGTLSESLDGMTRNLSASQEKLQGVLYILTDGAEGNIDSVLSPYVKIYEDVPLNSPYFDAVNTAVSKGWLQPLGENVFGAAEAATLGEFAQGLALLQGNTDASEADSVAALMAMEQAWLASLAPAEEAPAEEAVEAEEAPAEETADVTAEAEEAADGIAEAEEAPAEEAADVTAEAEEAPAEEAAEAAAEAEEAPAEETVEAAAEAEEAPAEEPAEVTAEAEEAPAEEAAEAAAEAEAAPAEEAAEVTAEAAEDGTLVLTRERLTALCKACCFTDEKELPEILFPESDAEEATRGDLAIVLVHLASLK